MKEDKQEDPEYYTLFSGPVSTEAQDQKRSVAEHLNLLLRLMRGIATSRNVFEAFNFTLQNICELTRWACGEIWVCDLKDEQLTCITSYNDKGRDELIPFREMAKNMLLKKGEDLPGRAWAAKNTVWVDDIRTCEYFERKLAAEKAGLRSALCVPVPLNHEVIAVACFYLLESTKRDDYFIDFLTAVSGQLGMAIKEKEAEEYLRISEMRFRSLVQATPEAIIIADAEYNITLWNHSAEKMFGYTANEVLDKPLALVVPEQYAKNLMQELKRILHVCEDRRSETALEYQGKRKDGTLFPMEIMIACWENDDLISFSLIIRDISKRIRHEQEMMAQREALAEEVAQRKEVEKFLLDSSRELKAKNQELEQFAYVASHDLQEPLRMVASYTQLLSQRYGELLDAEGHEFLQFALEGAGRMQALINDLLTLSRIGTRGRPFVMVNMGEVVETAKSNLALQIAENQAVIEYHDLPEVIGDRSQLVQLIQNLLSNALKFHKEGVVPEVKISSRLVGNYWEMSVSDNGIGIEPEQRNRVFQIFQRLHTRQEYPGTGIGLALCKKIVERHGGEIHFESKPGVGTTFIFTLKRMDPNSTIALMPGI